MSIKIYKPEDLIYNHKFLIEIMSNDLLRLRKPSIWTPNYLQYPDVILRRNLEAKLDKIFGLELPKSFMF